MSDRLKDRICPLRVEKLGGKECWLCRAREDRDGTASIDNLSLGTAWFVIEERDGVRVPERLSKVFRAPQDAAAWWREQTAP